MRGTVAKVTAFLLVLVLSGMAVIGFLSYTRNIDALRQSGRENIVWAASQLEIELGRFTRSLQDFAAGEPGVDADAVNRRYDILWSRLVLFSEGSVGDRLSEYDAGEDLIAGLFDTVRAVEPQIVGIAGTPPADVATLIATFDAFGPPLRGFSAAVNDGEVIKSAAARDLARDSARATGILILCAILLAQAALVYIYLESRRYQRLADHNLQLADAAEAGNRAKSRFLTMMSHELRTPMNGVLGLLALLRQGGLQPTQTRLVEQAERSGQQMTAMLSDILDFAALQDNQLEMEIAPFRITELARAVDDLFAPEARRAGIGFSVSVDPDAPDAVTGDFARLRQSVAHFAAYLVNTAVIRDLSVRFAHADGQLTVDLLFAHADAGADWRPELILGRAEASADRFASDALGPAVARSMIELMGGDIRLAPERGEQIAVRISAPLDALADSRPSVGIRTGSAALEAICRSGLPDALVRLLPSGSSDLPDILLLDSALCDDGHTVAGLRAAAPDIRILSLGEPRDARAVDGVIAMPIDMAGFRERLRDLAS
ncbi:histidine kinase dimerization/phospho-acceptor domain-containing protein [Oceanomicrobium pacificus]|uniref:histidine kinase n=1 Tax=Oceanomicrobium pacificus TaxID=2692916 RepID=A0A6B0TYN3_9RHOB|nr:histidine kinase dimerization/phospho-acceptor domain-containing protein [Oceanomicrobium pacificus]MXU66113.1 hypothetical protein [Oceanomicrobium pacificus]